MKGLLIAAIVGLGMGIAYWVYDRWKFNRDTRALVKRLMAEHRANFVQCQHCWAGKLLDFKAGSLSASDCPDCWGKGWLRRV